MLLIKQFQTSNFFYATLTKLMCQHCFCVDRELKAGGDLQGALRYALRGLQIYKGDEGAQKYAKRLCKKLEAKF